MNREKRYYPLNDFLREKFGCKVYKVSLDAGFTCPNRDGTLASGGCIYCDSRGSAAPIIDSRLSIRGQMKAGIAFGRRRYKAKKFIAYFQAFSNTYAPVAKLKKLYDEALNFEDVVGLSISTRPDCAPNSVLNLIEGYAQNYHVWLEYGIQSIHHRTLQLINRQHGLAEFTDAVLRTKDRTINICAHVIIGLPGETRDEILETAKVISALRLDGVKIHSMYIVRGTKLEQMYKSGDYEPLTFEEYVSIASDFLELLPPNMVIQRLTGDCPGDILVAPEWTLDKQRILTGITEELKRRDSWQGSRYLFK
ncbi:TPA: TIGR01212 family radical SAM protein [Candidatus Poribacteria bacterium]|nr:TIGR01212 family radical SAM protein [Candidatus Poribacteria bacterium]